MSMTVRAFDEADARQFAHALRVRPREINPEDWSVDWADGPWPVKVYSGGQRLPMRGARDPVLTALGRVLFGSFAITRVRFDPSGGLPASPDNPVPHAPSRFVQRRPVPSGGAMYPTEVYVLHRDLNRLYHYDPYRHELVDLRHPAPAGSLWSVLAEPLPQALVILTNRFWKNFYKYGDFAYRLGAVDVGVALGRTLRLGTTTFGQTRVRTDFDDQAVNTALGLDGDAESAYAAVLLGTTESSTDLSAPSCSAAPHAPAVLERSRTIKRSARFDAMHRAARSSRRHTPSRSGSPAVARAAHPLPPPREVDPTDPDTLTRRTSNGRLFTGAQLSATDLSTVLHHTARASAGLCSASADRLGTDVELHCAVHRVADVPSGWYVFRDGALHPVGKEADRDAAGTLQRTLFADTVNIELAGFTVHPSARDTPATPGAARDYREQQLAVGVAVEAVTLLAAAVGLGSHPFLGFDAATIDDAYGLTGTGHGVHAQVCVGAVRADSNWEVRVMPR